MCRSAWAVMWASGPRRGPVVTTCNLSRRDLMKGGSECVWLRGHWASLGGRRWLHCAFCTPHTAIHWLGALFVWYRTEIHIAVAFPFYTGISHYHSREFGNEKGRESRAPEKRAPGNDNPNYRSYRGRVLTGQITQQTVSKHSVKALKEDRS